MTREEEIKREALSNSNDIASEVDYKSTAAYEGYIKGAMWADANPCINWQQVRIQAAISAMQLIQTDETFKRWVQEAVEEGGVYYEEYPRIAVNIADALVEELKGE